MASTELIEAKIDKEIAGALPMTTLGVAFKNIMEVMEFAKMMAISDAAVPPVFRGNPGACLAVVSQAAALGFEPFSFARKCYFVNEQMAYESQLVHAIIIRRGPFTKRPSIAYRGEGTSRQCIVTLHMKDGEGDKVYESPKIADIKTQNSPLWKSDPDQQLAYYSVRAAARRYVPDVIMGMYDPEEMAAERAKDVTPPSPAKERVDISAKLAAGTAMPATAAQPDAPAPVQATAAAPGPETAAEPPNPATDAAPQSGGDSADIFAEAIMMELESALGPLNDPVALKVVWDEFEETFNMAPPSIRDKMAAAFTARGFAVPS